MHAASDDSRPALSSPLAGSGVVPRSSARRRADRRFEAGQGQAHGQGMAVQPVQEVPERPPLPSCLGGRVRGQQASPA